MPREDRRVIFDFEEAYKALYAMCTKREVKRPPPGVILSIEQDRKDETKIYICIENMQDNSASRVVYSYDFIAAALMLFCRGCNIPLPKSASKSVEFAKDNVVLRVRI